MFYGVVTPSPEWSATSHPIHRVGSETERPHILPSCARKFAPKLGHSSKIGALLIFILPKSGTEGLFNHKEPEFWGPSETKGSPELASPGEHSSGTTPLSQGSPVKGSLGLWPLVDSHQPIRSWVTQVALNQVI